MTWRHLRCGDERGVAMVEFALVIPLFLLMVLSAIDWGWFFVVQDAVSNAAREGARAAIVGYAGDAKATSTLNAMLPASESIRCTATQTTVAGPPQAVRVVATCPVGSLTGITTMPPFDWVRPPEASALVEMRL
jgi:Flp pilus assembly protein TadG